MGIMSTSSTVTRLRVLEPASNTLLSSVPDKLKQFCFHPIDDTIEERAWGWVCFDDMLDNQWHTAPPEKGEYMFFSLRIDVRRIPGSVLKKELALAFKDEEKKNKEQGKKFISRERKKELKEQARLRLLTRIPPQPTTVDVVWATARGMLYVTTNSPKTLDLLSEHFTQTFDLHVEPMSPYTMASTKLDETSLAKLDTLEPAQFA